MTATSDESDIATAQSTIPARGRTWLFWATLAVALGEAVLFVVVVQIFAHPTQPGIPAPIAVLPVAAVVAVVLDILCLILGRRANRILGAIALVVVLAQVIFVTWVVVSLAALAG
jgi:hypothetical protein